MDRAANSSWLHGLSTAALQMCAHRTCVHSLSGGEASGPSGSASHGEAVKVPGGGLSGLSGSRSARLIVGTAGMAEGRKGRLHNTDMKTHVHACRVPIVHMNTTCTCTHKSLKVELCGPGPSAGAPALISL